MWVLNISTPLGMGGNPEATTKELIRDFGNFRGIEFLSFFGWWAWIRVKSVTVILITLIQLNILGSPWLPKVGKPMSFVTWSTVSSILLGINNLKEWPNATPLTRNLRKVCSLLFWLSPKKIYSLFLNIMQAVFGNNDLSHLHHTQVYHVHLQLQQLVLCVMSPWLLLFIVQMSEVWK